MKKFNVDFKRETDEFLEIVESILLSLFIVFLMFTYFFQISTVDGRSMEDTLQNNERVISKSFFKLENGQPIVLEAEYSYVFNKTIAEETAYRALALQMKNGDIPKVSDSQLRKKAKKNVEIINADGFRLYKSLGINQRIVKRVIATEGQRVRIDFSNGDIFVDGEMIDEPYIKNLTFDDYSAFNYPSVVPEGYVYVLGDNRSVSKDSRHPDIGLVPVDHIVGVCFLKVYPITEIGFVH
ncbi:MAG: signal peptidase I [Oscillospiraceae bacterium]|nr:signal peptidase I [Oscillospiraceae bacterium]